ncbi:MAG: phosphopantothenate/pantothenate synthetase [Spirochaetales bacterium]|nr:phosphopantothenate/pantothenate synthetase [Spirochaetales bacterium]
MGINIPESHPRAASLKIREALIRGVEDNVVAYAGLIAHGRGEAFDYLIGEKTIPQAQRAIEAAAASLLNAAAPVISVNGNTAVLVPRELVGLSEITGARLEVNLFYRTREREEAVRKALLDAGGRHIYGVGEAASEVIDELQSERRRVDPDGILKADVVLVPLEDGDRTKALVRCGKTVITVDLNPLSRTSRTAHITIVDNITRTLPALIEKVKELKTTPRPALKRIVESYDNKKNTGEALRAICDRLLLLAGGGTDIP